MRRAVVRESQLLAAYPCQVHVILPKDDRSYWKALFEDGEERSYYELLKEAVDAGEHCIDSSLSCQYADMTRSPVEVGRLQRSGFPGC